ncbi:NAD(P)/FAD-dependent oxidoreductase [Roseivivax sp. CAU 1761]
MQVCVIGAGLIGAAAAAELAAAGARVTVLAADRLGGDTSAASLSWLNAADKPPEAYTRMNLEGMRRHAEFAAACGTAPWYHRGGNLRLCFDSDQAARVQGMIDALAAFDYPARWLSTAELLALEPDLSPAVAARAEAAFFSEEAWITGAPLIARLLADARAHGAEVRAGRRVTGFDRRGDRIAAVLTEMGDRIAADAVVLAAGARSQALAAAAGCALPMTNERGFQAYTAPAAVTLGRVIHSPELNLRPDGAGRICLHDYGLDGTLIPDANTDAAARADSAAAWTPDPAAVETLRARLAAFYPATEGTPIEAARVGMRPIPEDRRPVLGRFDACPDLYAAVMHSGATQALWAGDLIRREIVDDTPQDILQTFRPSRFADRRAA